MSAEVVATPFDTASAPPLPQSPSRPGSHHIRLTSHASGQGVCTTDWLKAWPNPPYAPWAQPWGVKSFAGSWAVFLVAEGAERR